VTAEDIDGRIAEWKKAKVARISFMATVNHNGTPLPGATVTYVPEAFLGSELQTATGQTDDQGHTIPTVPVSGPEDAMGVAPGFYRVQITKQGENIPAKYNTDTVFGAEVFTSQEGDAATFNLEY
jgi:hypothetical protein